MKNIRKYRDAADETFMNIVIASWEKPSLINCLLSTDKCHLKLLNKYTVEQKIESENKPSKASYFIY